MKKSISTFGLLLCLNILLPAQPEKEITSSITKVILYTRGAQVESEANVSLQPGQMTLKFTKLSPYIRNESVRVEGDGSFIIQNVLHQNDYINELDKNKDIEIIKKRIEEIKTNIEYEQTWIKILGDKLDFLKTNKDITGKEQAVNSEVFSSLYNLYGNTLETLNLELLKKERLLNGYNKEAAKLDNQLSSLNNKADLPSGTILVTINSKQVKNAKIKFSYLVENASWYPSYDIRFTGVDKPLIITFKANISQNTGVDWTDVNLVLSTAKTNVSAQIPVLSPFYLQFYYPEITRALQGRVSGVMVSEKAEMPASMSQISVRGASSLNGLDNPLYVVDGVPQNNISSIDPNLIENIQVLKDASATSLYGSRAANGVVVVTTKQNREKSSIPLTIISKREVSNEYTVDMPQTILSRDKTNTITFREANLNATFEYQTVPLKSEHVFLIGKVTDWYKTDLLDGEANIYLENSYVGKSIINTQQFTDTLELSFGVDNNISVKRAKLTDFSESQFIGLNRKETVAYKLTLRNNKAYAVRTKITDQIPVSSTKEIQVETLDITGGEVNNDTGEVLWELELKPNEMKDLVLKYSVRYPKNKKVIIE